MIFVAQSIEKLAIIRFSFVLLLAFTLSACASFERDIVGLGVESIKSPEQNAAAVRRVFIATTRQRSNNPAEFFDGNRSQTMQLGYMDVYIPKGHQPGKIERPKGRKSDPEKHFILSKPTLTDHHSGFQRAINDELAKRGAEDKNLLVFVHGYNTNFSTAALRVAQFVHDTNYAGIPVLFSWASRGKTLDYLYDLNSALQARDELVRLGVILADVQARNYDIVAHSMGNLVTLEAMRKFAKRDDVRPDGQLRNVILASPDIDIDLFETQLKDLREIQNLFTVLVSDDDRALSLSRSLAGGISRVGATDPVRLAKLGLNIIDLSEIDDKTGSNHSKFSSSPEIVQLIGRGIHDGNTLSAQTTPSALRTALGGVVRGITIIPTSIADVAQAAVISVGN